MMSCRTENPRAVPVACWAWAAAALLGGCASAPAPVDRPLLLGRVEQGTPARSTAPTRDSKLAMSPAAMALKEAFRGGTHQVYSVRSADGVRWSVASPAQFAPGACVQAWGAVPPLNVGYARLGELTLKPAAGCT